ncbi:MAG: sensor histidine kinase [Chthoniobacterales bacterium]
MVWILVLAAAVVAVIALRFRQRWVRPWRDLDRLIDDVIHARSPHTFLIDGNPFARRIGIALEDVFLKQRELTQRAAQGELDVRMILSAIRDGLAVVDQQRRVRLLNSAAREMFSISGDANGATPLETFRDSVIARRIEETLRTGAAGSDSLKLNAAKQVVVTSLPMHEREGAATGAVVLFQDVTQLQHLEQVRRDFVSNVSHELRTPLSIFRGYLETLLDEPSLPADERERILRVLEKHSSRLNALVDDLLSLARLEEPGSKLHRASVSLREFLPRVSREWEKRAATKQITLHCDVPDDLPEIEADEARLEEIAYNLLDNAINYSNAGGEVALAATRHNNHVVISVADQGTGISSADLPRIFERFYRADKARSREVGGTGLGLAIVKHIAELHGGRVEAQSQLGRGTTVRVLLPVVR